MAPFSTCSQCNKRTRKVVKDPKTLKNIYLCPKCTKTREERVLQEEEHKALQCAQLAAEMVQLEKPKEELKLAATQMMPLPLVAPLTARYHAPVLQTPPIMQTVVINGRKYIAVSATASDN